MTHVNIWSRIRASDKECPDGALTPRGRTTRENLVIESSVAESRAERMIRAYCEGAESGMLECRGYGLSEDERVEAFRLAVRLYGGLLEYEQAAS